MGNRRISAGIDLALEVQQIVLRTARLRMHFGIGRHLDMEGVAKLAADELDQLVRVAEFTGRSTARWQVTAQCDQMFDAIVLVALQPFADVVVCGGNT